VTAYQLIGPLPAITLDSGCTITFDAIDPASGAAVTGVTVTLGTIYGNTSAAVPTFEPPSPLLVYAPEG